MIDNLFWILNYIRTELLEKFELPELGISYWEFLCLLAIVGMVITVLVNSVQVSGGSAVASSQERKRNAISLKNQKERESYDWYKRNRERNEAHDDRYRIEHGQKLRKR